MLHRTLFFLIACAGLSNTTARAMQGPPRVAIAAAAANLLTDCRYTDLQSKLQMTGRFSTVDLVDVVSTTPSVQELLAYDSVITWGDAHYSDPVLMGDTLAEYVDQGGGVVVTGFANMTSFTNVFLQGRWLTGAYELIRHTSGLQSGPASLGTIVEPGHPVAQSVSVLGGALVARPFLGANFALNQGRVLMEWNDGRMLAAVSNVHPKRVDLGLYPVDSNCVPGFLDPGTDMVTLVANALEFAANGGTLGSTYCVGVTNSTGGPATLQVRGATVAANNDLRLHAIGLPQFTFLLYVTGRTQGFIANPGGSQGNLCLGGNIGRFNQQIQNSGAAGVTDLALNLMALPEGNMAVAAMAGETWNFQAWYRDNNPGVTSNFTSAVSIAFQ